MTEHGTAPNPVGARNRRTTTTLLDHLLPTPTEISPMRALHADAPPKPVTGGMESMIAAAEARS